ncbi:MAG: hypothetical protein AB8B63_25165 [Granulosicoccus sp.]
MRAPRRLPLYAILASVVCVTGCVSTQTARQLNPNVGIAAMSNRYLDTNEELIGRDQPVSEITCPWQLQMQGRMAPRLVPESNRNLPVY